MAFTPLCMKTVLFNIAKENQKAWRFTDKDLDDFSSEVAQDIRLMCRHFSQAMSKGSLRPKWVDHVLGEQAPPPPPGVLGKRQDEEEEEEVEEEQASPKQLSKKPAAANAGLHYFVGYDSEEQVAWRAKGASGPKEFTKCFFEPANAQPDDSMLAKWPDGFVHELAALTVGQSRAFCQSDGSGKRGRPAKDAFAKFGPYSVREKQDRSLLIWISDDTQAKKQLCMLRADTFPEKADVVKLMADVAEALAADPSQDPYKLRNEFLEEFLKQNPGIQIQKPKRQPKAKSPKTAQPKKRPAASRDERRAKAPKANSVPDACSPPTPEAESPAEPPTPTTPRKKPDFAGMVRNMMALPEF